METIKLIGIVIIVLGFAFRLDILAVVVIAGITTGLVSGMGIVEILETMGTSFVGNRLMSLFLLSLPVIAILERYGLKERAAYLISKIKNATAGKILSLYSIIRVISSAFSLRLGGHVQFVRPLILPMVEAAAETDKGSELTEDEEETAKGLSAAMENYGNFFGQNIFPAASGVILIQGTLKELGYVTSLGDLAIAAIPIGIIATILSIIQSFIYDKKLKGGK